MYSLYVFIWVFPRRPISHSTHNNPTVTWHASLIPPAPYLPIHSDCPLPDSSLPHWSYQLIAKLAPGINIMLSSHHSLSTLHPALEDGTDRGFQNISRSQSDAGEIPKRIHTIFRTRRKFEIKNGRNITFPQLLTCMCRLTYAQATGRNS
jgi:hypothetical protein